MKRVALYVGAVLVLIVLGVSALRQHHDNSPQAQRSLQPGATLSGSASNGLGGGPEPTEVATPTAAGQSTGDGQPAALDPISATKVVTLVGKFTAAYLDRSYTDAGPTAWLARVKPLVTPDFYSAIVNQANSDGTNWSDFVKSKATIAIAAKPHQPVILGGNIYAGVPFTQTYTQTGSSPSKNPGFLTVYVTPVSTGGQKTWLVNATSVNPPDSAGN